jgi:signal transduction histidine kinase
MRERVASIGATLEVTSEPGGGTVVRLRIENAGPLAPASARNESIRFKEQQ